MSKTPNSAKNTSKYYSRKDNMIYNTKAKSGWRYKYNNIKAGDKIQNTVKYKRRNVEYDASYISYNPLKEDEIKWNLGKNRTRNYTNEAESGLYDGGNTQFKNAFKENYIKETDESKYSNQDNRKNKISQNYLEDMKIISMKKMFDVNNKSETSRNSNRYNHSYHESYYSNGNELYNKLCTKLTFMKVEIINSQKETKNALLQSLGSLESISKSMAELVKGQKQLIELMKKDKK